MIMDMYIDVINYEALLSKISEYAKKAGRWNVRTVLLMWYVLSVKMQVMKLLSI